ncbi:hypothetical protein VKT23_014970 [Stygiomarasmius scandens]|uniref:Uncharacterized protein n=1 Tax=Marasmiellus scandens TaxID=2682957 RepID=A0ABR1IYT8_9AGAR
MPSNNPHTQTTPIDWFRGLDAPAQQFFVDLHNQQTGEQYSTAQFEQFLSQPLDFGVLEEDVPANAYCQEVTLPTNINFNGQLFIRFWRSPRLGQNGYYNFDFADCHGTRINTPPGIELYMVNPRCKLMSRVDIELQHKKADPHSYGIDPATTLPPLIPVFILFGGKKHILTYQGRRLHEFTPPEVFP